MRAPRLLAASLALPAVPPASSPANADGWRVARFGWATLLLGAMAIHAAGCGDDPATQLVVVVGTDYQVPAELDRVQVRVLDASGVLASSHDHTLRAAGDVPFSLVVAPRGGDASRRVTVEAEGFAAGGGGSLVVRRAETGFRANTSLLLEMFLARSCEGEMCGAGQTCTENGCASAAVPPDTLPAVTPGAELRDAARGMDARMPEGGAPDDGVPDGRVEPDAGDMGGGEDAGEMDAARPDAGPDAARDTGPPRACTDDLQCDDMNACTDDTCGPAGTCEHVSMVCDDRDPCTGDECDPGLGSCRTFPAVDGTVCTGGTCCGGACLDTQGDPTHCGASCEACAPGDVCTMGVCTCTGGLQDCDPAPGCESNPTSDARNCGRCGNACSPPNPACIDGVCGACAAPSDCSDDGLACTGPATCTDGACDYPLLPGTCLVAGVCYDAGQASAGNPCMTCQPTRSTTSLTAATGTSCDDGLFCTTGDACSAGGSCAGTPRDCGDSFSCTTETCDEARDTCDVVVASGCLISGACVASGAADPLNACATCQPAVSTSSYSPASSGSCDDGRYCTTGDTCMAGVCTGTARDCADTLSCTMDTCDEMTDACVHTTTTGCVIGGACVAEGALDPANSCRACLGATSRTAYSNRMDGTSCNDSAYCTNPDTCTAGTCGGPTRDCADSDLCTIDGCNESTDMCTHMMTTGGCTIGGACVATGTRNPANECQACQPATSTTAYTNLPSGATCSDGLYCMVGESCNGMGSCTGATSRNCADSLTCTTDSCNEAMDRCDNVLMSSYCVIGGACIASGTVDPANQCRTCQPSTSTTAYSIASGRACDDGLFCNDGETCNGSGVCTGGTAHGCADALSCTTDSCNETTNSCDHPVTTGCLISGTCIASNALDPTNQCRACQPTSSTTAYTNRGSGSSCDDGLYCNTGETCNGSGSCTGGGARNCADAYACTTDSCDEAADTCRSTPDAATGQCFIGGACYASGAAGSTSCLRCIPSNSASSFTDVTTNLAGYGYCNIGGTCVASGYDDPSNECRECRPATSTSAYSAKPNGTSCSTDVCCAGTCRAACSPQNCVSNCSSCTGMVAGCFRICNPDGTGGCTCDLECG